MKIYYRISDAGYKKVKAPYINNENCLKNFVCNFLNNDTSYITVIADNMCESTLNMVRLYVPDSSIIKCKLGSGAQTFNLALNLALKNTDDQEIIYFVENDYIHRKNSKQILEEGFDLGADIISLYDHIDKYINSENGGNPFIENNGEISQVFVSKSCHWKLTNSTTMTFASKLKTLKKIEPTLRKWTKGTYPEDFKMFIELREIGKTLISPLPSYSTHGDLQWMAPLIDWSKI